MSTNFPAIASVVASFIVLAFFVWMLIPTGKASNVDQQGNELIDPTDARQLGTLFSMYGMQTVDVAIAKFAVERFVKMYGRPPPTLDIGILVGLMKNSE